MAEPEKRALRPDSMASFNVHFQADEVPSKRNSLRKGSLRPRSLSDTRLQDLNEIVDQKPQEERTTPLSPEPEETHKVFFKDDVEVWDTYETYTNFFSAYDRRSVYRKRNLTPAEVEGINSELKGVNDELFPNGRKVGDRVVRNVLQLAVVAKFGVSLKHKALFHLHSKSAEITSRATALEVEAKSI
eukprot:comp9406_c0_seq1/m.4458 comp9406_c0_seq1/g.4458  ORF comp9406_c0_seq1/g.4458 comp9406_c0_seq1/m.4458 type:complete len:187 (-) comp9406_c0_seq1:1140-1700(-)